MSRGAARRPGPCPSSGVARENEAVPQGKPAVGRGLPHGRAPGKVGEREVREDRVRGGRGAFFHGDRVPWVGGRVEIRGTVEPAAQEGLPREGEGQQGEDQGHARRDGRHEAPREPHGQRRRGGIGQPQCNGDDARILRLRSGTWPTRGNASAPERRRRSSRASAAPPPRPRRASSRSRGRTAATSIASSARPRRSAPATSSSLASASRRSSTRCRGWESGACGSWAEASRCFARTPPS